MRMINDDINVEMVFQKKMLGNDKTINFWRARRVKGLGFYRTTEDYMFSLDYGTDAKLLEPGVLLEFEDRIYRVVAKQVAFVKKDNYATTKRLSPVYHIYLENAEKRIHLYSEGSKKQRSIIKGGRIKKPRDAVIPEVTIPREIVRSAKPTKEEKLLAQYKKTQVAKRKEEELTIKRAERAAKKAARPIVKKKRKRRK